MREKGSQSSQSLVEGEVSQRAVTKNSVGSRSVSLRLHNSDGSVRLLTISLQEFEVRSMEKKRGLQSMSTDQMLSWSVLE